MSGTLLLHGILDDLLYSAGEDGDYGIQRAWGTVGWGLMGPVSGLMVDLWSGTNVTKDYTPAFLICLLLGSSDVLISARLIKVKLIVVRL